MECVVRYAEEKKREKNIFETFLVKGRILAKMRLNKLNLGIISVKKENIQQL